MTYTKYKEGEAKLIFTFAPPQTHLDPAPKPVNPNKRSYGPKFPDDLTRFTQSVYYYWWEFLRLNEDYRACCERAGLYNDDDPKHLHLRELYRDFGDVRDREPDQSAEENFKLWWIERGWVMFVEPPPSKYVNIQTKPFADTSPTKDKVYVCIDRNADLDNLTKKLKAFLNPDAKEGTKRHIVSFALYKPKHIKFNALAKYLKVKKAELEYLKLNGVPPSSAMLADIADLDYQGKGEKTLNRDQEELTPPGKATAGRETLKAANNIINYVVYGQFPVTKPDKFFDRKSDLEKVATLPKVSDYLRFSDNWINSIHEGDHGYEDFAEVRRDVKPTREELGSGPIKSLAGAASH
jgi:hypothetical protein